MIHASASVTVKRDGRAIAHWTDFAFSLNSITHVIELLLVETTDQEQHVCADLLLKKGLVAAVSCQILHHIILRQELILTQEVRYLLQIKRIPVPPSC